MSYLTSMQYGPPAPGAFESMTDALDPSPGVVPKSHFVEWFSGSALDAVWTLTETGSGTDTMADEENGGWKYTTGANTNDKGAIDFSGKRHYSETGSVLIAVTKFTNVSSSSIIQGLVNLATLASNYSVMQGGSGQSLFHLLTRAGGSPTQVNSSVTRDTNFHKHENHLSSTASLYFLDDILEAVGTSALPTAKLMPFFRIATTTTEARTGHIRYLEAYNT